MARVYEFHLSGITCTSCTDSIETLLSKYPDLPITGYETDVVEKTATIEIDANCPKNDADIRAELNDLLDAFSPRCTNESHGWKAILGLTLGGIMMASMLLGFMLPQYWHHASIAAGGLITAYLGRNTFYEAYQKFKLGKISMAHLYSGSTLSAVAASVLNVFYTVIPMLMDAALMIFGFKHLGSYIDKKIRRHLTRGLKFADRAPREVSKQIKPNQFESCALESVVENEVILIQPGQVIPLDGYAVEDELEIFDTLITGNILPRRARSTELLYAGMVNHDKPLLLRVEHREKDSYLCLLDKRNAQAKRDKAPTESLTNKLLPWFLGGTLLLAAGLGLFSYFYLHSITLAISSALYLAVCACPCVLGTINPAAMKIGINKAADKGVVFNSTAALEAASTVDTVCFDISGTVTENNHQLLDWDCSIPGDRAIVAALEAWSSHPIGKKISDTVGKHDTVFTQEEITPHKNGIIAVKDGNTYAIGDATFIPVGNYKVPLHARTQHVIYFMKNGIVRGHFIFNDPLRPNAKPILQSLIKNGKRVKLITGLNRDTAYGYADDLNIPRDDVIWECRDKPAEIVKLQKEGKGHQVAMFGDSGNDSIALTSADLGVVMQSCATDPMTIQNAGASIGKGSLKPVLALFTTANQTMQLIHRNLGISLLYNLMTLAYVASAIVLLPHDLFNPAYGAGLMAFQSIAVWSYTLVVKYQEPKFPVEVNLDETAEPPAHPPQKPSPPVVDHLRQANELTAKQEQSAHSPTPVVPADKPSATPAI